MRNLINLEILLFPENSCQNLKLVSNRSNEMNEKNSKNKEESSEQIYSKCLWF